MIDVDAPRASRRALLASTAAILAGCGTGNTGAESVPTARTAPEAWGVLTAGNARFAAGSAEHPRAGAERRAGLVSGQSPIASVLSCADSRVPPEILFDQGLGDLFTIRSAGEVLDEAVLGSVEYAVGQLGVPLVVVLGHSGCGAVGATVDVVRGGQRPGGAVGSLVRAIEPVVRGVPPEADDDAFLAACVEAQARQVAAALPRRSPAVHSAVAAGDTSVVAAVYDRATGAVALAEPPQR